MSLMDWNSALDIGVPDMNHEHQGLLDYMNKLYELHLKNAPPHELKLIVDRLRGATVVHFQHEEAYMEKIGWDGLSSHTKSFIKT